jgi:carboxyvinyl-carboxyphosphonate phosphorylmutase
MLNHTDRRLRARAILAGSQCLSPASVFDALSARVAEMVGYELGLLSGSVASCTTLAEPDLVVLTLTEFAAQIRRIMRASSLSLVVDADHGYGNALNVMRTVAELEHAGVSILGIEDTVLPMRFGREPGANELVSIEEMTGKLRAALAARRDPSLVIAARSAGVRVEGVARTVERVKAYAATGVDAIFVVEVDRIEQIEAVHAAVDLPIIVGSGGAYTREEVTRCGGRILLQGHQSLAAAIKALRDTYAHLHKGGEPADLGGKIASAQDMSRLLHGEDYTAWQRQYLR